ncbi:unnamed protein product [Darwinula stevensoni]|uniref:Peptidase S1 domain-containing protein n=1 Tax=Darwinula stevensoni TaxID=69355 RepID=A0A7R9AHA7_9CRUS|nr:unnamed protein product [Darwinula stevensoni]CAG0904516.1 unnamed protein product [Darwinula stevensoni]
MLRSGLLLAVLLVSAQAGRKVSMKNRFIRTHTHGKIVGGIPAEPGQFPYQVSMQYGSGSSWSHYCGGSILDETHVLTAGHCDPLRGERVVAGTLDLANMGETAQVREVIDAVIHPEYFGVTYDAAVVTVDPPFEFNQFVGPAALPFEGQQPSGNPRSCTPSGWGATLDGTLSDELLYVDIDFIDDETCIDFWGSGPIPEQNICAGNEEGFETVCYGDSGGPLYCEADDGERYLFGSTSWGPGECGLPELPAVWAEVPFFEEFILEQIGRA